MDPLGSQTAPFVHGTANSAASALFSTQHHAEANPSPWRRSSFVFYTHAHSSALAANTNKPELAETVLCSDFDSLLNLLEVDAVDGIVFDASVSLHERNYITRWARIFRPELHCRLQ